MSYTLDQAIKDSLLKWEFFSKFSNFRLTLNENITKLHQVHPHLNKLQNSCGFCECFRCSGCPLLVSNATCRCPTHPYGKWQSKNTKKNAKVVLKLTKQIAKEHHDQTSRG